jgi:hypothetical protein
MSYNRSNSQNQPPIFGPVSLWTYPQFLASKERHSAANKLPEPWQTSEAPPSPKQDAPAITMPGISISGLA